MPAICFYFQVHQPFRIQKVDSINFSNSTNYFEDVVLEKHDNKKILDKVSTKCYLPTNQILLELLRKHPEFRFSFSLSGVFLEQIKIWRPDVLESFQELVKTGRVEILSETYYHSLSFLYSQQEFISQIKKHDELVEELFGQTPQVFRNTELIYNNDLALCIENLGYSGIITEGADHILGSQTPNFLYEPPNTNKIKLFLKNYKLSDDIAFRFSNPNWNQFPLQSQTFASWIHKINGSGEIVNLFMDYESFGEHQWEESGIFEFLKHLPKEVLKNPDSTFITPSEAVIKYQTRGVVDIPNFISWADTERDLSAWRSNSMQTESLNKIYDLEFRIKAVKKPELLEFWRRLQTSDHFYYMCTKYFEDGDIHKYFSPYESPHEAFVYFMNAFRNLKIRLEIAETSNIA
jgi:alpha-amylase